MTGMALFSGARRAVVRVARSCWRVLRPSSGILRLASRSRRRSSLALKRTSRRDHHTARARAGRSAHLETGNMSKHTPTTPGPWVVDKHDYCRVIDSTGESVADTAFHISTGRSLPECYANARLAAAAPAMKAALELCRPIIARCSRTGSLAAKKALRDALAKLE